LEVLFEICAINLLAINHSGDVITGGLQTAREEKPGN
jgi:hypothetical protein